MDTVTMKHSQPPPELQAKDMLKLVAMHAYECVLRSKSVTQCFSMLAEALATVLKSHFPLTVMLCCR